MTVLLISSCYAVIVGASPAKTINYQGQLKDNTNTPITTPTTIRFSIYNNPTTGLPTDIASGSGPLLWTEIYDGSSCAEVIPNSLGIISVRLGSCTNFPAYLTFNDDYYLGLTIESNSEATPRLRLSSVPYSENVRNITFDNNTANAFRIGTTIADYLSFNTTTGSERITLGQNTTIGTPSNTLTIGAILQGATPLVFEGSTVDGNRTSIAITDPTGNRIITLPDNSGTVALLSDLPSAITASNGLSRVLNDMQLGGVLTQDTLIDGNGGAFDLTFQDLKSFDIGGGGVGALGSISNTNVDVIATNLLQLLSPLTYVQSGTPNVSGLRLVNLTSSAPTGLGQAIGVDVLGNIITVAGGSLTTANNGLTLNPAGNVQLGGVLIQNTNINLGVNTLTFDQTDVNSRFKIQGASAYGPGFASQDVFQLETFANEGFAITSYQSGPLITDDHGMFLNFTSNLANPLGDSLGAFIYSNRTTGEIGMGRFGGGQISISDNGIDLRSNGQNNFQAETSQTFFANNSSLLLPGEAGYNFTTTNAYNSDLAVANFSSGTGSGIDLFVGGFNPNGQFTGNPGSIYFNITPSDDNDILWLKSPFGGFNTNTGWIPVAVGGPINDWSLTGNFGTDGGVTNFLGTLDAQDFVIKVDNIEKGRFYNQYNSVAFGSGQAQSGGMFVFGSSAGLNATNAQGSNFFNRLAGANATNAFNSNFMGEFSGFGATNANNSNFFGQGAGQNATNAAYSNFFGQNAGLDATNAYQSNFFGIQAGLNATNAFQSNFFGLDAGISATDANNSNFFGIQAGLEATNADQSNFFGEGAGSRGTNANNSNFFGQNAGNSATDANNSNFLGTSAGSSATNAFSSNFIGRDAGNGATFANDSNFLGSNAGANATNAQSSNFFGSSAGQNATNASNSSFFGTSAGNGATNAAESNFFGLGAGQNAINANNSNFFGLAAGQNATDAAHSNFFGQSAGREATNANFSNFFGLGAGSRATNAYNSLFIALGSSDGSGAEAINAHNSIFVGFNAGSFAANANNSIFIGFNAGSGDAVNNSTGGTSILIGDNTRTGGFSNSIALGENAVNDRTNQFLVGPAYSDFSFRNVNYTFPSAQATGVGEVLTNDGTGILSWAVAGIGSVTASNGLNAVGIDVRLGGALTQPTTITATGGDNLTINGSNYTTNTGMLSVSRDAGSAAAGAAIQGNSIVNAGVPLVQNVGGRFDAVSGDTGVATVNYGTLNTASVSATAPGIVNVGSRNVANFNISGGNLASLRGAENSATLGAGSVGSAFGSLNDILLQNGTNITNAHGVATSLTKGATASVSRYSGFYMEDNNTGIANRSGLFLGTAFNAGYTGEWGIYSGLDRNNAINGSLSVGSLVAPVRKLEVTDVATTNVARFSGLGGTECSVVTGTGWSCSSDERLKDNITNIMSGTNIIVGLRPVTYNWKTEGTTQYGFVAQEVQQLVPELVIENSDGYLSLNTSGLIPYIVKSQQEQIVAIKSIEDQLTTIQLSTNTIDIQNITDGLSANMAQINTRIDEIDSKLISMQTKTDELFAGSVSLTLTDLSQLQDNIQINNLVVTYANITNLDITGNTKISGLLSISKPIQVSSDIAGKAVISAGVNHVDVTFTNPYVGTPIVTVSNVGDSALTQEFKYSITNITASGFRIQLNTHVLSNLEFNWIALDRI